VLTIVFFPRFVLPLFSCTKKMLLPEAIALIEQSIPDRKAVILAIGDRLSVITQKMKFVETYLFNPGVF